MKKFYISIILPIKRNLRFILFTPLFSLIFLTGFNQIFGQNASQPSSSQPGDDWLEMIQDPNVDFHKAQEAFNNFWEGRTDYKGNGYKIFKRWEYINESRVLPDGKLQAPDHVLKEYNKYMKNVDQTKSVSGAWSLIGPSVYPTNATSQPTGLGRVNAIAFHPTDANTIYVGAPSGGLWKTTDGGSTWVNLSGNLPKLGVSAILIHPTNPSTIYIGTGDRDSDDAPGIGVYISTNGGTSWTAINSTMGNVTVGAMLMHPSISNTILAATSGGIYKTTDGGTTWSQKQSGDFRDIKFKPGDPTYVYATRYSWWNGAKFYRSTNTGDNWTNITSGILNAGTMAAGARMVIGVSASNSSYVYLLQINQNTKTFQGLLRSTNSGTSFTTRSTSPNILDYACNGSGTSSQATYDLCLTVDPLNADIVYVGSINNWKWDDNSSTWTIVSHWLGSTYGTTCAASVHADQHVYEWSPHNGRLYVGHDGGITWTGNAGLTWTEISGGLAINQIYKIGQSATTSDLTIFGQQDNGTAVADGSTVTTVYGGDGTESIIDYGDDNYKYACYVQGAIKRSTGGSYYNIVGGLSGTGSWVTPYILHETVSTTMFAGYQNVHRTTNVKASPSSSVSWSTISTGETNNCIVLEQSPAAVNILYAVRSGAIKRSDNANAAAGSVTWTTCTLPGGSTPTDLEAHPTNANIVYATAGYKVHKSTNKGASWTDISGTLPSLFINCIVYDKNSNEGLYIGNQTNVYFRDASMTDWTLFSTGLPPVDVRELEIYYDASVSSNNRLKAATYGRGLWESDLRGPPVAEFSADNLLPINSNAWVNFTDQSIGATSWSWTITPGTHAYVNPTSSTSQNPTVSFNQPGAYTVTLQATNSLGSDSEIKTAYIHQGTAGVWKGTTDTDWNTGTNWENHLVPTSSAGVTIHPGPTIWPTYTGNFNVGTQCAAISMAGNSEFTVTGDLTIPSGSQIFCAANSTINVDGDFVNYGTFTPGNSLFKMNGNTNSTISGNVTTNNNLTTSFASGLSQTANYFDITANGANNISINSFDINCFSTGGNVSVQIWYTTTSYIGNQNNPGVWTQLGTTQSVASLGTGNATPVNPGASVTIPAGSTYGFYISCYQGSAGTIVFSGGNSSSSNSDITINCGDFGWTNQPGNGGTNGYSFNGTVYYSYVTSNPLSFFDLEINKNNALVTTDGDLTINDFTIKPGAWFTNSTGDNLNILGNTLFEADASGLASFLDNGNTTIGGVSNVQQYISENQWHLVSPPVAGATSNVFLGVYLKYFVESDSSWHYITSTSDPLIQGTGYSAWSSSATTGNYTANYNGALINTDLSPPLSYTAAATHLGKGWNMIGNPYPSAIHWNSVWARSNVDATMYIYDGGTSGNYLTYNTSGMGSHPTGDIAPGQGFWIMANNTGPSITIPQSERKHSTQAFYKSDNEISGMITITAEGNEYSDNTVIYFSEEATLGFDSEFDAWKMKGLNDAPQLYSINQAGELAVNVLPFENQNLIIPLGFEVGVENIYSITTLDLENLDDQIEVYLEDLKENTMSDLRQDNSYAFNASPEDDPNRFLLHFNHTSFGTEDITSDELNIYSNGSNVYLTSTELIEGNLKVINLLGETVYQSKISGSNNHHFELSVQTGYYLVSLVNETSVITQKVLIK